MLTAKEALDLFNAKYVGHLPKGVTARVMRSGNLEGVVVGTKDLSFSLQGESLAHGEDYMFLRAKQSLEHLKLELDKQTGSHPPPK